MGIKYSTSTVVINNTAAGRCYVARWRKLLDQQTGWCTDQWAMYHAFLASGAEFRFGQLPKAFVDWDMHLGSRIWCGKGERKESNRLYHLSAQELVHSTTGRERWNFYMRAWGLRAHLWWRRPHAVWEEFRQWRQLKTWQQPRTTVEPFSPQERRKQAA